MFRIRRERRAGPDWGETPFEIPLVLPPRDPLVPSSRSDGAQTVKASFHSFDSPERLGAEILSMGKLCQKKCATFIYALLLFQEIILKDPGRAYVTFELNDKKLIIFTLLNIHLLRS